MDVVIIFPSPRLVSQAHRAHYIISFAHFIRFNISRQYISRLKNVLQIHPDFISSLGTYLLIYFAAFNDNTDYNLKGNSDIFS